MKWFPLVYLFKKTGLFLFSRSVITDSLRPHGLWHARPPCPSTISQSLLKFMSIDLVMASNHLILWHPLLLLPSIFPRIRGFSNELAVYIRRQKHLSFSFSISPSKDVLPIQGLRLDLFAIQGVFRSLLQYYIQFSSVQSLSHVWLFVTLWTTACLPSLSITNY